MVEGCYRQGVFSLQTMYADDPLTWDYMARRELEMESKQSTEQTTKQMKITEMTQREERCCAVFEEAVGAVPTGESSDCILMYFPVNLSILYTESVVL